MFVILDKRRRYLFTIGTFASRKAAYRFAKSHGMAYCRLAQLVPDKRGKRLAKRVPR